MSRIENRKRVVVLASGRGTNLQALIEAARDPAYPARVVAVFANRPDAVALQRATDAGIACEAIDQAKFDSKEAHETRLMAAIDAVVPDIVCLAGYMRVLSPDFVRHYAGRLINIHPSLLPAFRGLDTHARALQAGVRIHGASVHFVTEGVDEGPVIAQAAVGVRSDDTAETLAARVLAAEHQLYPSALALVACGQARLSGTATVTRESDRGSGEALFSPPLSP